MANKLNAEIPNSIILDQYSNVNNPLAHYHGTAEEIIAACGDKLDVAVIGAGTGGTISGIAKRLKEHYPGVKIVGVDPLGSILANPADLDNPDLNQPYYVEGIGYDFVPDVMKHEYVDWWVTTRDEESFRLARRLIRSEGLLCGGSSGSALVGAIAAARHYNLGPEHRLVVVLPDSVRNYMSKFLSADWMLAHKFMEPAEYSTFNKLKPPTGQQETRLEYRPVTTIPSDATVEQVVELMQAVKASVSDQFPVLDRKSSQVTGNFDAGKLFEKLATEAKAVVFGFELRRFMNKEFVALDPEQSKTGNVIAYLNTKVPCYLVDHENRARLSPDGSVQTINAFKIFSNQ